MNTPIEWLSVSDAAKALGIMPSTVNSWARTGKFVGSAKDDRGHWLVLRSEIDRILEEREQAVERRLAKWRPMTDRDRIYAPDVASEGQHA